MRFLVVDAVSDDAALALDRDQARRLRKVLRRRDGDAVRLLDLAGGRVWEGVLGPGDRVQLGESRPVGPDPHPDLRLYMAPAKGERSELAARMLFELGLRELALLETERGVRAPGMGLVNRLQRVARSACEQSGREHLARVVQPRSLRAAVAECRREGRAAWLLHPGGGGLPAWPGSAALFVGPEGGFTEAEVVAARDGGAEVVGLGGHVLRLETAAVAAGARVLAAAGWGAGS